MPVGYDPAGKQYEQRNDPKEGAGDLSKQCAAAATYAIPQKLVVATFVIVVVLIKRLVKRVSCCITPAALEHFTRHWIDLVPVHFSIAGK